MNIQQRIELKAMDLSLVCFDIDERNGLTAIDSIILSCGSAYQGRKQHETDHQRDAREMETCTAVGHKTAE